MNVLKSHLLARDKNTQVLIVKTVLALRAYQVRVKPHKLALIAFAVILLKKAALPVKVAIQTKTKAQVLEIQIPTLHAVFDVASNQ
jgi:hypothetical protein